MLTIPVVALMTQGLHEEYLYWLQHQRCDDQVATNAMELAFIQSVEEGRYDVSDGVKADAHRLYLEVRTSCTAFSEGQNPGQTGATA